MQPRIKDSEILRLAEHIGKNRKHTLIIGAAGLGKSMIAQRVRDFMPPLTEGQQEVADIYRAAAMPQLSSMITRPFRAPHHTCSTAALIGSKAKPPVLLPRFGELSLAHRGLLLLDEIPEFRRDCLEHVAFAMKHKFIVHGMGHINWPNWHYPTDFQLIATANWCPCGQLHSTFDNDQCKCTESQIKRYQNRFSMIPFQETIEIKARSCAIRPLDAA